MKPITISEQMMFNTVKLETETGSGTGFFFSFTFDNNSFCPVIITNKHVINYKKREKVKFTLHIWDTDMDNATENVKCEYTVDWFFHSKYDLCFCFFEPIRSDVERKIKKKVFYITNDEKILATQKKLDDLSQLEEVVMIGYPIGLSDSKNNFPIFRKGYTATHPAIDFNGDKIGIVDMACFPGSSGSPIFILNESSYTDKKGTLYAGKRVLLLGIQFAVPVYNTEGKIDVITKIPTLSVRTEHMTNLGYYIKAEELLEFKKVIKDLHLVY